jgi:hypothetical protein
MVVSNVDLETALQGRTPEQQKVIRYFMAPDGCLSRNISDEEYDKMVWNKTDALNLKQQALDKTGFDESPVNEIPPVEFRHWFFGDKTLKKRGLDGLFRSSAYQITWLFFGAEQLFVYQYTLHLEEGEKTERVEKYFYGDIASVSVISKSEETEYQESGKGFLNKEVTGDRKFIHHDVFYLIVPGEKFECAIINNDETAGKIRVIKANLREKNG